MPKTKTAKPSPAVTPSAATLARQLAEKRLAFLTTYRGFVLDGLGPSDDEEIESDWVKLVEAVERETNFDDGHGAAGFMVGLEVGRRLGGAR